MTPALLPGLVLCGYDLCSHTGPTLRRAPYSALIILKFLIILLLNLGFIMKSNGAMKQMHEHAEEICTLKCHHSLSPRLHIAFTMLVSLEFLGSWDVLELSKIQSEYQVYMLHMWHLSKPWEAIISIPTRTCFQSRKKAMHHRKHERPKNDFISFWTHVTPLY